MEDNLKKEIKKQLCVDWVMDENGEYVYNGFEANLSITVKYK